MRPNEPIIRFGFLPNWPPLLNTRGALSERGVSSA
jgi:hypothetical protein